MGFLTALHHFRSAASMPFKITPILTHGGDIRGQREQVCGRFFFGAKVPSHFSCGYGEHTHHEHKHHTIHENHDNTTKTQTHTGTNSFNTKHATAPHRCEDTRSPYTHSHHTTPLEHRHTHHTHLTHTHPATTQHTMLSQFVFALKMTIK